MPQMINLVLNDGAADHTFKPRGIDQKNVATLVESTGVPIADRRLTVQRSRTAQGREKVVLKMTLPVVVDANENGITRPTVVRTAYADITFSFDGSSTSLERAQARFMLMDLLGDSQQFGYEVIDSLESLF